MDKYDYCLHSIHFKQLKCLNDATINFDGKRVIGIFGPNGIGKSTVLHALACSFKPVEEVGEDHRFPNFFKYYKYQNWLGTEFNIEYSFKERGKEENRSWRFAKPKDRWLRE